MRSLVEKFFYIGFLILFGFGLVSFLMLEDLPDLP